MLKCSPIHMSLHQPIITFFDHFKRFDGGGGFSIMKSSFMSSLDNFSHQNLRNVTQSLLKICLISAKKPLQKMANSIEWNVNVPYLLKNKLDKENGNYLWLELISLDSSFFNKQTIGKLSRWKRESKYLVCYTWCRGYLRYYVFLMVSSSFIFSFRSYGERLDYSQNLRFRYLRPEKKQNE